MQNGLINSIQNTRIKKAKKRFDSELHTKEYRQIHSDQLHLDKLMEFLEIEDDERYLDLGTGNGYLAFEMARRYRNVIVTGLDIAEKSINLNNQIVEENSFPNVMFNSYDGTRLPYSDAKFRGIISRYAFHHFPDPELSIREIRRILKKGGFFIFSDPMTYPEDKYGFIDRYQELKDDGHWHFYYEDEVVELFRRFGLMSAEVFYSYIRYPRPCNKGYENLLENSDKRISDLYETAIEGNIIYITVRVMNIFFRKV